MRRIRTFADAAPRLGACLLAAGLAAVASVVWGPGGDLWTLAAHPQAGAVIVFELRLPRIVAALLSGALLAGSGAVVQALLRNPLAGPEIMGVSAGAAAGAVAWGSLFGLSAGLPVAGAFLGAGATAVVIFLLATRSWSTSMTGVLLAGLAVSSLLSSITTLLLLLRQESQLSQYLFWIVGSLHDRRWSDVLWLAILGVPALLGMIALAGHLNVLSLGDTTARSLGLRLQGLRFLALAFVVIATAASVAVCGAISFLGLLVPHAVRLRWGQDFRWVVPLSALVGAAFLAWCDFLVKLLGAPLDLPVGLVTGVLGVPFFLYLLIRHHRRGEWNQ